MSATAGTTRSSPTRWRTGERPGHPGGRAWRPPWPGRRPGASPSTPLAGSTSPTPPTPGSSGSRPTAPTSTAIEARDRRDCSGRGNLRHPPARPAHRRRRGECDRPRRREPSLRLSRASPPTSTKTAGQVFVKRPHSRTAEPLDRPCTSPWGRPSTRTTSVRIESADPPNPATPKSATPLTVGLSFDSGSSRRLRPTSSSLVVPLQPAPRRLAAGRPRSRGQPRARSTRRKPSPTTKSDICGNATGRPRRPGENATAADKGTEWLTADYCNGTLVRVAQGVVFVRPLRGNAKPIRVTAGNQIFVRAPLKSRKPASAARREPEWLNLGTQRHCPWAFRADEYLGFAGSTCR